jgi:hypothetical protein
MSQASGTAPPLIAPNPRRGFRSYVAAGWRLGGDAIAFVRGHEELRRLVWATVPALATVVAAAVAAAMALDLSLTIEFEDLAALSPGLLVLWLIAFLATLVSIAVAGITDRALRGEPARMRDGVVLARERLGAAAGWAVAVLLIGIPTRLSTRWVTDQLFGVLLGFAWSLLSFFAIPAMALGREGPVRAARHSVRLAGRLWGQGVAGVVYIWVRAFIYFGLPGMFATIGGAVLLDRGADIPGAALLVGGLTAIAFACQLTMVTSSVLAVALYRYAESGETLGPLTREAVELSARPPSRPVRWLTGKLDSERLRRFRARVADV